MGRLDDIVNADSMEALIALRRELGVDDALEEKGARARIIDRAREGRSEERDYVRDPAGRFDETGKRDSAGGKDKPEPATAREHVVKPGDTLAAIAERELGDASRWTEIRDASGLGKDFDPRKLQVGTKLSLPPKDGEGRRRTDDGGVDRDGDGDSDPALGAEGYARVGSLDDVDRQLAGWDDNVEPEKRREQRRRLLARARELGATERTLARIRALPAPDEKKDHDVSMQTKGPAGAPADIEHKAAPTSAGVQVLETDDETGIVTALVSVTGVVDNVKDQIEPGAYTKTMAKREPIGVWSHDDKTWVARTEEAVELHPGDPFLRELKTMDGQPWDPAAGAVKVTARFNLETPHGKAAYSDVKFFQGKTGWSIGYRATKAHRNPRTGVRHIKELDWYEYSPVMVGAASQPMTLSVKSMAGAHTVDPLDDTGLVDDAFLEELTLDELDRLDSLKSSLGLETKARVRTPEGAQRYGQPIGSVIVPDAISGSVGAKEVTRGMQVEFQGMGPGGPSDPKPVKGTVEKVSRDGNITTLTVGGEDHKLIGNSPVGVTGGRGGGKAAQITDRELVTMLQEAEDDDERKLIKAAAALPAGSRRAFLTSGGKNDGSAETLDKATDKPDDDLDNFKLPEGQRREPTAAERARRAATDLPGDLAAAAGRDKPADAPAKATDKPEGGDKPDSGGADRAKLGFDQARRTSGGNPPGKEYQARLLAATGASKEDGADVRGLAGAQQWDYWADRLGGRSHDEAIKRNGGTSAARRPEERSTGATAPEKPQEGFVRQSDGSVNPSEGRATRDGMKGAGTGLNEHSDAMAGQGNSQLESFIEMTERMNEGRREAGDEPFGDDHEVSKMLYAAQDELRARKEAGAYDGKLGAAGGAKTTPRKRTEPGKGEAGDLAASPGGFKEPANAKGETVSDFVNATIAEIREEEYRQLESDVQTVFDRWKDNPSSGTTSSLISQLSGIREDGIDGEKIDDAIALLEELLKSAAYGGPGRGKKAGTVVLEHKGSRASLDRSPRANWVENAGELPGYIREVARAIEREQGVDLSRAIAIAIGRIKTWARGGGNVNADTVAKAATAVAAWEALKAKNAAKYDSELLELIEHKAYERIELVEQLEADGLYSVELKALVDDNDALADDLDELGGFLKEKALPATGVDDELVELLARAAEVKGFAATAVDDDEDFEALLARRSQLG